MKMNQQNDGFWTHFWATVTALASAAGLTTEQWVYVLCAILGALLSLGSFLSNRKSLKAKQAEDEKRTEILRAYLHGREVDADESSEKVAEEVKGVMDQVGN
ncbi:hypothetical protein LLP99_17075 [Rouxiella badensis]|uniref:hypothetical protein n=1 Tax=Rouxiella badensis TaxID=1646377 RepID=UPI001D14007E|nr:hypothetical protein [Rouxiella badensis]MCC3717959.1 hypothetical protein [Rouxiella badensis]MCC3730026.1 hypothetical protein [Rouxiella badensis]